jgi:hypothetical protein
VPVQPIYDTGANAIGTDSTYLNGCLRHGESRRIRYSDLSVAGRRHGVSNIDCSPTCERLCVYNVDSSSSALRLDRITRHR